VVAVGDEHNKWPLVWESHQRRRATVKILILPMTHIALQEKRRQSGRLDGEGQRRAVPEVFALVVAITQRAYDIGAVQSTGRSHDPQNASNMERSRR
jgi:hypothetical protein